MKTSLTPEDIENLIFKEEAIQLGRKTTVVVLTLMNGFEVVGSSACVDPAQYNLATGTKLARQRAIDKVWEVVGYKLQADLHEDLHEDSEGEYEAYANEEKFVKAPPKDTYKGETSSFDDDDIPF